MIISMSDILCVTNRKLCRDDFLSRIEEIVECSPSAIILREKDLSEFEYEELAVQVMNICRKYNIRCILHSFVKTAIKLGADKIHLPLSILRNMTDDEKRYFIIISAHTDVIAFNKIFHSVRTATVPTDKNAFRLFIRIFKMI